MILGKTHSPLPAAGTGELQTKILSAALVEISACGFNGVSLNQIAKRAKISAQRLNYHYQSIDQIIEELVQISFDTGRHTLSQLLLERPPHSPEDVIFLQVESLFEWHRRYPEIVRFTLMLSSYPAKKDSRHSYANEIQVGQRRIMDALAKKFPKMKTSDIDRHSTAIHFMMIGGYSEFFRRNEKDSRAYSERLQNMIRAYLELIASALS